MPFGASVLETPRRPPPVIDPMETWMKVDGAVVCWIRIPEQAAETF